MPDCLRPLNNMMFWCFLCCVFKKSFDYTTKWWSYILLGHWWYSRDQTMSLAWLLIVWHHKGSRPSATTMLTWLESCSRNQQFSNLLLYLLFSASSPHSDKPPLVWGTREKIHTDYVIMMVADVLMPNRHQTISNHHMPTLQWLKNIILAYTSYYAIYTLLYNH